MNATATLAFTRPDPRGRTGLSVGWTASLLAHAAILAWLLHAPAPRPPEPAPSTRIEVRLAPAAAPEAPPRPAAEAAPAAPPRPARPAPAAPARAPAPAYMTAPAPARATPDTNEQPSAPAAASGDGPAAAGDQAAPAVDIGAARQAARLIAREGGKSLVALPARKPVVDPNADRAEPIDPIEAARRKDCKSAYAGAGLLAVIPLAIDAIRSAANDSGCKW